MKGTQHQQLPWLLISSVEKKPKTLFYLTITSSPFSMNLVTWCTTCVPKVISLPCRVPKLKVTSLKCHLRCLKTGSGMPTWPRDWANIMKPGNPWVMRWSPRFLKWAVMVRHLTPCTNACWVFLICWCIQLLMNKRWCSLRKLNHFKIWVFMSKCLMLLVLIAWEDLWKWMGLGLILKIYGSRW